MTNKKETKPTDAPTEVVVPDIRARLLAVAEALNRIDVAIEQLTKAGSAIAWALPANHDATDSVDVANERARVARAKVEIVLKRIK